jgi:hypothetical protein
VTGRAFLLLRTHGGYAGATDEELLHVPYANLLQALRLASEQAAESARDGWRRAAFVGWQLRSAVAGAFGGSTGSQPFGAYLRQIGLGPKAQGEVAADSSRARENAEKVARAFRERGVQRVE